MTPEEALNYFKRIPMTSTGRYTLDFVHGEAIDEAIKALEKQIPKKVNTKLDTYSYCPECDSVLASTYYKAKYCHCCGQRLER